MRVTTSAGSIAAMLMTALVLSSCAATENKLAVPYQVRFQGTSVQNPNAQGHATPVQVTVYQLRAQEKFQQADYFALQQAEQYLGDQLLAKETLMVPPEGQEQFSSAGHIEARYLGVVAAYRDLDHANWRLLIPLPAARSTNIYKFWQFSPRQALLGISVNEQGLDVLSEP